MLMTVGSSDGAAVGSSGSSDGCWDGAVVGSSGPLEDGDEVVAVMDGTEVLVFPAGWAEVGEAEGMVVEPIVGV